MNNRRYETSQNNFNFVIFKGQERQTIGNFTRDPRPLVWKGFLLMLLLSVLVILVTWGYEHWYPEGEGKSTWNVFFEGVKILVGALSVYLFTLELTNRWQQRSYSFDMIKELNSEEFMAVRYNLSAQMQKAIETDADLDDILSWFPYHSDWPVNSSVQHDRRERSIDDFRKEHALPGMLYFVLRLSNYYKFDMLNQRLTRHLFHFFFCHYEIVLLEFARKLKEARLTLNEQGYGYDERWDLAADDVCRFFRFIGLAGELAPNHRFIYFPSLNTSAIEENPSVPTAPEPSVLE